MARLRVTILGCGSSGGVPRLGGLWGACDPEEPRNRRRRCSILVERVAEDGAATRVLIDTSPDMRDQLLGAGVGLLDAVVYTHPHADHVHGIDDLRMVVFNRQSRLPVWADAATSDSLLSRFAYAFVQPPGSLYPPILDLHRIEGAFVIEGAGGPLRFLPLEVEHGGIHALGFRVKDFAYIPDVSEIPEKTWPALARLDTLVLDALRYTPHPTHAHLERALGWIERLAPRASVLTNMHIDLDYATLAAELPPGVAPAHDGLILDMAADPVSVIYTVLNVVLPVFLVMGAGFAAARTRLFPTQAVDGLMLFTQTFGVPCVLFTAIATLDLGAVFDPRLLLSYYSGALTSFLLALFVLRRGFARRPGESVAIAFGALFSNAVLLGLPILSRAYGDGPLGPNFAIISIHAPFCYLVGITAMELARADGQSLGRTAVTIGRAMFRNALMIGLALGFIVNLGHVPYPEALRSAVEMIAQAALPVALFGLGGILSRYRLRSSFGEAATVSFSSLLIHPLIALVLAHFVFDLPPDFVRACVVTASMAPGVNAYIFANLYQRGQAEAASSVLMSTCLSVLSCAGWISLINLLLPAG